MAAENAALYAFNAGEVDKRSLGRVDVAKLRLAASCQVNWMPWIVGPMMLRPGLLHVGEVLNDSPARLLPFVFAVANNDTALLEFTNLGFRIWVGEQLVTRPAVATVVADPTFGGGGLWSTTGTTDGCTAAVSGGIATLTAQAQGGLARIQQTIAVAPGDIGKEHGLRVVVSNGPVTVRAGTSFGDDSYITQTVLDTGTHCLAFTPTGGVFLQIESSDQWSKTLSSVTIDPAGPLAVPTLVATSSLKLIRQDQSGDIIFGAVYGQQQFQVQRRSAHGWSFSVYRSGDGPFAQQAAAVANLTPSQEYGNGNIQSDRPVFNSNQVGMLVRLFQTGQTNATVLGGLNAATAPVRVVGVGTVARNYTWTVAGTFTGTITLERSFDGPTSGFNAVSTVTAAGTIPSNTGTGSTPNLDNVIAWERLRFSAYTNGSAQVSSNYAGGGGFGIARVTGFVSPTQVNVEILENFVSLSGTQDWAFSEWSTDAGWPTSVCFHEGRLGWYGYQAWLSASNGYTSFAEIDNQGNAVGDSGPIDVAFGSGPIDVVSWGLSLTRLLLGREKSIASVRSSNFDQPVTPADIVIRDCSVEGAARIQAFKLGKRGIFVQQSGARVYELAFDPREMDYGSSDLTRLNFDIGKAGFVDGDVQIQPDMQIWLPRGDGMAACLLRDFDDDVTAWWRVMTLGVIENVAVVPQDGIEDLVYFVVRRTINGTTRRFIERLAPRANCVGGVINAQADCHALYQGAPTATVSVPHLPMMPIVVWADGEAIGGGVTDASGNLAMPDGKLHSNYVAGLGGVRVIGTTSNLLEGGVAPDQIFTQLSNSLTVGAQYNGYPAEVFADLGPSDAPLHVGSIVVANGAIALPNGAQASIIVAFLGFIAPFMSAKLAYAAQMGSAITQTKKVDHVGLVMLDTYFQGVQYGQRFDVLDDLPQIESEEEVPAGTIWPEYDAPMIELPGEWNTDARLCLVAQAPNPAMISNAIIAVKTNEK
jgi:hypothetical protein